MNKRLFCEISPLTYKVSVRKGIFVRRVKWMLNRDQYALHRCQKKMPVKIYEHRSLIRRKLGNVNMELQDNKATNLGIAVKNFNGIIIRPNEVFSFWRINGDCTEAKGYKHGLVIKSGNIDEGIGGGMCQFTNLIHWMVLHSPLTIVEHHHHNQIDMFQDFERQIPFGTGTSIMYNYLDYQFVNNTDQVFQLITYVTEDYLCGELRSDKELEFSYHIVEDNSFFTKEKDAYYRNNEIFRNVVDKKTGSHISRELIIKNHSKVLYDERFIPVERLQENYSII